MKKSEANIEDLRNQTVSWGTHRPDDLIPKFMAVLKEYGKEAYDKYVSENPEVEDWKMLDDETKGWVVDELFDLLDGIAPEDCYFGALPGDGADFGFWQVDESKRKESKKSEADGDKVVPDEKDFEKCPYCGSHNTDIDYDVDLRAPADVLAYATCKDCGKEYHGQFIFTGAYYGKDGYDWGPIDTCPFCGSKEHTETVQFDGGGYVDQDFQCKSCGKTWYNSFVWSGTQSAFECHTHKSESKKSEDFDMNKAFFQAKKAITDWAKTQGHKTLEWAYTDGRKSPTSYPSGIWDFEWDTGNGMATAELKVSPYKTRTNSWNDSMDFALRVGTEDKPTFYTSVEDVLSAVDTLISETELKTESKKSEKGNKDIFTLDLTRIDAEGDEEGLDDMQAAQTFYDEDEAIQAAKDLADSYKDDDDVVQVTVNAGEQEKPNGDIVGEPFDIFTASSSDSATTAKYREKAGYAKTDGLDYYAKGGKSESKKSEDSSDMQRVDYYADKRFFEPEEFVKYVRIAYGKDGGYVSVDSVVPVDILNKANRLAQKNGYKKLERKVSEDSKWVLELPSKRSVDSESAVLREKGIPFKVSGTAIFIKPSAEYDDVLKKLYGSLIEMSGASESKKGENLEPSIDIRNRKTVELSEMDYLTLSRDINSSGYYKSSGGTYIVYVGGNRLGEFPDIDAAAEAGYVLKESKKSESLTLKQKELKNMARYGEATDITTISDAEAKELKKKGVETVGVSRGVFGMNGALLRDNEGNKYVITARSSNLFYFI